jgi:hypothetical protein
VILDLEIQDREVRSALLAHGGLGLGDGLARVDDINVP